MKVLITGCYGFLGYSLAKKMLEGGHDVVGIDRTECAVSDKRARIDVLARFPKFFYWECDISDHMSVMRAFRTYRPTHVVHFAAQFGMPHDTELLQRYIKSNFAGFINVIENAKLIHVERFVYASSYSASDNDQAWSMYSVSKAFNEDCARIYSERFGMKTIGIRYGSVFGPQCRTDCAPHALALKLLKGEAITFRDRQLLKTPFLDVDDAVDITQKLITRPLPKMHNVVTAVADDYRYNLYDLLMFMVSVSGITPVIRGDLPERTVRPDDFEDIAAMIHLYKVAGMKPKHGIKDTIEKFMEWLQSC